MKPPLYGVEMFTAIRDYAVTLNIHIDMAGTDAGNCRLFEVTGAGGCLLTDWKENLTEMFELDHEVVVYRSHEECLEKARWLLEHPSERNAIACAGQARVLREHTFAHRAAELDRLLHIELAP
jgi:spore maturation protein CgeB